MKSFLVLNSPSEHLRKPGYREVAKLDTKLSCEPDFETWIEEFARNFGLEIIELKEAWNLRKNLTLKCKT